MDETKKDINIYAAIGIVVLIALVAAGFYYYQRGVKKAPEPSATQALEEIESAAPEVAVPTSPIENKIPSLNPVEKVNPFKSENPLR